MTPSPQPVRALDLARKYLPKSKDADYIIRILETKARRAEAKAPAKAKRVATRSLLRRAGLEPKTKSDWLREADKWFSRFIRLRDSKYRCPFEGYCLCVTCERSVKIEAIDNGHWIRREHWGTRFHEHNCHSQCKACNNYGGGKEREHQEAIEKIHGSGSSTILLIRAEDYKRKPSAKDLEVIAMKYKAKVTELGGWPE